MITASIVTYNHHLLDFEGVLRSLFASPVQLIYIIDHSEDMLDLKYELQEYAQKVISQEPELSEKQRKGFQLIYIPHENNGYGGGHNVALHLAAEAGSEYHLVVNPDVWFGPEVVPKLMQMMDKNPDVGMCMPKVLYPNGQIQRVARLLPTPIDMICRFCIPETFIRHRNQTNELVQSGFNKVLNVSFLSGCFMFIRKQAIEECGMFDERFFLYAEDIDLTRRINRKYKTLFYPRVTIYHTFTRQSRRSIRMALIHIWSVCKYFNKWGWWHDEERTRMNQRTLNEIGGKI